MTSWLDIDPPQVPAIVSSETKFSAMVDALKRCSPKQRRWISAMQEACFDDVVARKALATTGVKISRQRVQQWEIEPAFVTALRSAEEYVLAAASVAQVGVVAQLQRAVRVNGATIKCRDDAGQEYEKFVDAGQLNAALDRLAKRVRLYGDEDKPAIKEGPALVIQINATPGAVNVTPTESNKGLVIDLPRPDREVNR